LTPRKGQATLLLTIYLRRFQNDGHTFTLYQQLQERPCGGQGLTEVVVIVDGQEVIVHGVSVRNDEGCV
jgi:hypothetical protein